MNTYMSTPGKTAKLGVGATHSNKQTNLCIGQHTTESAHLLTIEYIRTALAKSM